MRIHSPDFPTGGTIPAPFTCDGQDRSPALAWEQVPAGTQSLVLIVDDPDAPDPAAPKMTWVHWLVYNLPADSQGVGQGAAQGTLPTGALQGRNDWQRTDYGGPCPPVGKHRYFHKLYALDTRLPDLHAPGKAQLEAAMRGHVLASCELVGTYQKH